MTFYEKILREIRSAEQSLRSIYGFAFRFTDEIYFETNDGERIYTETYGEVQKRIERVTNALHAKLHDVPKGSCVGLFLPNCPDWVVAFWSILRAGYRPLLLNTNASAEVITECLKEGGATHLLSERRFEGFTNFYVDALVSEQHPDFEQWADEIVLCTSGTTGKPKLIVFDGKAVCAQIQNSDYVLQNNKTIASFYKGRLKLLAFLPFYHIFGLSAVLLWFSCVGRTMVFLPSLSPEAILNTCRLHEVTHIFAMPLFWNAVADGVVRTAKRTDRLETLEKGVRLSLKLQSGPFPKLGRRFVRNVLFRSVQEQALGCGVRFCITGGGAIRNDTMRIINGMGYPLYNGYGMTEIGIASVELRHSAKARLECSVGKLFPTMEGKLLDQDADGIGMLAVRGKTCFTATYRQGERIARDPMEWFPTEDYMQMRRGRLYFSGRKDDLLNGENGERISPLEIESAFGSPKIAQLCVVQTVSETGKTEIVLVAEPKSRNAYRLHQLTEELYRVNATLPSTHRVHRILLAEEPLPLALTMKVSNREVRSRLQNGTLRVSVAERNPEQQEELAYQEGMEQILQDVMAAFQRATDCEEITPDSHFVYDLGGDSLQFFGVMDELKETYGIEPDAAKDLSTPRLCAAFILKETE